MDLVSLLITIIGIMVLLGLYVMSRVFDQSPAKQSNKSIHIPTYTDTDGNTLSSIKADIPVQNSVPAIDYQSDYKKNDQADDKSSHASHLTQNSNNGARNSKHNNFDSSTNGTSDSHSDSIPAKSTEKPNNKPSQYVLFIASPSEQQLDGNNIMAAMDDLGFQLGDKDIYHYCISDSDDSYTYTQNDTQKDTQKLFSVANGVSPWTLKETDLAGKSTPGLSLIMPLPSPIAIKEGITAFVDISEKLAIAIEGELQNTQQQMFLPTDKELMLKSAGC